MSGHYRNQKRDFKHQKTKSPTEVAQTYLEDISLLLDLENSTTTQIKQGVSRVEKLIQENKDVKAHQVRNVFNLVKDTNDLKRLNLLRPKLAYIGARQVSRHGQVIVKLMDLLIQEITSKPQGEQVQLLGGLKYISESLVAYHKFYSNEKD